MKDFVRKWRENLEESFATEEEHRRKFIDNIIYFEELLSQKVYEDNIYDLKMTIKNQKECVENCERNKEKLSEKIEALKCFENLLEK